MISVGGVAVIGGTSGLPAPSRLATDAALPAAASALAGSVARAEDSGRTYLCARTGAATYAWSDAATGDLTEKVDELRRNRNLGELERPFQHRHIGIKPLGGEQRAARRACDADHALD